MKHTNQSALRASAAIPRAALADPLHPERRITAAEVRELCGGISDMSLHRWLHDDRLSFPRPIYIQRRRYWKEAEVLAWLESQRGEAA